jgi:putative oxidoreductase
MTSPTTAAVRVPPALPPALLAIRLGLALFLLPWVFDKFVNTEHAIRVFEGFYGLGGLAAPVLYAVGAAQLVLLLLFVLGVARRWSYGLVLAMHAVSTLSTWKQYLDPYTGANLLFFAAWPALAAALALFLLRDYDTLWSVGRR